MDWRECQRRSHSIEQAITIDKYQGGRKCSKQRVRGEQLLSDSVWFSFKEIGKILARGGGWGEDWGRDSNSKKTVRGNEGFLVVEVWKLIREGSFSILASESTKLSQERTNLHGMCGRESRISPVRQVECRLPGRETELEVGRRWGWGGGMEQQWKKWSKGIGEVKSLEWYDGWDG